MPLVEPMRQPDATQARRVLKLQLIMTPLATMVGLVFGLSVALSALIGAGVCLLANAVFAFWVFRGYRAQDPGGLLMRFYGAEAAKVVLIVGSFAAALATLDNLNAPALLGAYFVVQVMSTLIAAQFGNRITKREMIDG